MRRSLLVPLGLLPLLWAGLAPAQQAIDPPLLTRAERTDFRETSRYEDVLAFLAEAERRSGGMLHVTGFGYSFEGRVLPLAVWGRVADASPEAVLASGRTRVYVQANIHAGEVEGKEASLALLRSLVEGEHRAWADSLVLLFAPIYNADGNERIALTHRPGQHGPVGGMGQRPNAQGLDLNRDHTKLDSPEARSLALLLQRYDPHVGIDLHATNGTYHAYHLTHSPPLHPATAEPLTSMARDEWLPQVSRSIRARHGWELHPYGNVPSAESPWAAAAGAERGWYTFDHRPRFGNNYLGLRNRFGILSEAYAYLTFRERVETTRVFVEELVGWAYRNATRIRRTTERLDGRSIVGERLALRATHARGETIPILMGEVIREVNPYTGMPMLRRADAVRVERMRDYSRFRATETGTVPRVYLIPPGHEAVVERLGAHGIRSHVLARALSGAVESFGIDSARVAEREFQGRRERTLVGRWRAVERSFPAGTRVVPLDQPLARLVFLLLEPRSDDGFAAWNLMGEMGSGDEYPVLRAHGAADAWAPAR